ncbi:MAG TPA: alpha/beta fold hydrolase [Candidatus Binatia bacterium]
MRQRVLLVCALWLFAGCGGIPNLELKKLATAEPATPVQFFYDSSGGKVEAFLVRPKGPGPFPLIVLVHGHSANAAGAEPMVPIAEAISRDMCYAGLAVSLPGYGNTAVERGGDRETIARLLADGIAQAARLPWIDGGRVILYGFSRGAVFAAASVSSLPSLRAVVLHSGAYDIARLYRETSVAWVRKVLNPNGDADPKLFNILPEVSSWKAPVLVLHGAQDALLPVNQAELLDKQLAAAGVPHRTVIFPGASHRLPIDGVRAEVFAFLQRHVGPACSTDGRSTG